MHRGYIKLHRKLVEWEWYSNYKVRDVFLHCLLKANHKTKQWQGITIERGSFITSYPILAKEVGFSVQTVRTALNKLKLTRELTVKTSNQNTLIVVNNYDRFQEINTQSNIQLTDNQHATNTRLTPTNNDNNDNNEKNVEVVDGKNYGNYYNVFLLNKDYQKLQGEVMNNKILNELIEDLSINIETGKENPYQYKLPHAHYERLKAYFKYRRDNPKVTPAQEKASKVWAEIKRKEIEELAEGKRI